MKICAALRLVDPKIEALRDIQSDLEDLRILSSMTSDPKRKAIYKTRIQHKQIQLESWQNED